MKPFPPQSPSSIADFEGCSKRWFLTKIEKKYPYVQNEQAKWGDEVHKKLENYTANQVALPDYLEYLAPIIDNLRADHQLFAEIPVAITHDWEPTDFWNKSGKCMLRGKIDLVAVDPESATAYVIDWKSGKRKPDPFQLNIYAAVLKRVLGLKTVAAGYAWIKTKEHDLYTVDDSNFDEIKADIDSRIQKMKEAYEQGNYIARTSPLCCWCPAVNDCEEAVFYKENSSRYRK